MSGIIVRKYDGAAFAYNAQTLGCVFVEGSVSELIGELVAEPGFNPSSFIGHVPPEYRGQARKDIEDLRTAVLGLVRPSSDEASQSLSTEQSDGGALKRLMDYAIRTWQPINATVELTYRCNLDCRFCYLPEHSTPGLSRSQLYEIGVQLRSAGVPFVLLTGGETFLRPDALDIMEDYNRLGFAIEAKSNGLLLDKKSIERLAELNLFNLQLSVYELEDGLTRFTGVPYSYSLFSHNVKMLLDEGIPVSLSVMVGKHNVDRLDEYQEKLSALGADDISYSPYLTPTRNGENRAASLRLSREEMDTKLLPFLMSVDGIMEPPHYRECRSGQAVCYAGRDQIAIDPSGVVTPCLDFRLPLGNVTKDSLHDILEGRSEKLAPYTLGRVPKCMDCQLVEYCDSCPGNAILESGDFTIPIPHKCDVSWFYHDAWNERRCGKQ